MTDNTKHGLLAVAIFWGSIFGLLSYLYFFGAVGLVFAALTGISILIFQAGSIN